MQMSQIVLQGTLKSDGTLLLDTKPNLAAGRVQVTLERQSNQFREDTWSVLERIWRDRATRGAKPRTKEEIDAYVNELREELEEHANEAERLQDEARRSREKPAC